MKAFRILTVFSLISLGAPQAVAQDNLTCVSLIDATVASLTTGFIPYWSVVTSANGEKGCARKDAFIVENGSCRFKNKPSSKPEFKSPECLYNGDWVDGSEILKQQSQPSKKSAVPVIQKNSSPSIGLEQSKPNTVSVSSLDSNVPSVMAKDYWVNVKQADIYDASNNVIGSLSHSAAVTTYGEKEGLGKIDLVTEKWIKLSSLSETKPTALKAESNAIVSNKSAADEIGKTVRTDDIFEEHFVSVNSLNYRDAPDGVKLGSFAFSTRLLAYERVGGWVRVSKAGDREQWVFEKYLSDTKPSSRPISSSPSSQSRRRLTNSECGTLRIRKLSVKTQSQFDAIEGQLSRGGCNSQQEARKKQWEWVQ